MADELKNSLLAAAFGMIGGGLLKMVAATWKRKRLHDKLRVYATPPHHGLVPVRVHNGYVLPLTNCWAYITLDYDEKTDLLIPPAGYKAHIHKVLPLALREDRICWSLFVDAFKPVIDIYSGESQALTVFGYDLQQNWIGIVSESMFKPWRVFIRADKVYRGRLKIISKETYAKEWEIKIDVRNQECPLTVRSLTCWFDPSEPW